MVYVALISSDYLESLTTRSNRMNFRLWFMQNMEGKWVLGNREWRKFTLLTIMTKLEIHVPFLVEFFGMQKQWRALFI